MRLPSALSVEHALVRNLVECPRLDHALPLFGLGSFGFLIWQLLMRFVIPVVIFIVLISAHLPAEWLKKIGLA